MQPAPECYAPGRPRQGGYCLCSGVCPAHRPCCLGRDIGAGLSPPSHSSQPGVDIVWCCGRVLGSTDEIFLEQGPQSGSVKQQIARAEAPSSQLSDNKSRALARCIHYRKLPCLKDCIMQLCQSTQKLREQASASLCLCHLAATITSLSFRPVQLLSPQFCFQGIWKHILNT